MNKYWVYLILGTAFLVNGCATVNTLDTTRTELPERVKSSVFDYPYSEVFQEAGDVCKELKLAIYAEYEDEGRIYAKSSWRWLFVLATQGTFGFGEKVGIYITALDEFSTKVEVVVQKTNLLDVGYADWRVKILELLSERLENKF
jgi:hypothetical protein